ncbi:MAG: hypothetical protein AB7V33_07360 [Halothiobacillus sp.]
MKTIPHHSKLKASSHATFLDKPTPSAQLILFVILVLSMAATRYHHFSAVLHIADTSWAAFFLAGLYLRARWMFVALMGLAVVIDLAAVWTDGLGMTGCFSPAYPGLLLAYGALWGAGRLSRHSMRPNESAFTTILAVTGWLTLGVIAAFALSNLSFWAWSGHFADMSLGDYLQRVMGYLGHYMAATSLYVGLGLGVMMVAQTLTIRSSNLHAAH